MKKFDSIEDNLTESLSSLATAMSEMSKDKLNTKLIENLVSTFKSKLDKAGSDLSQEIAYLSRTSSGQIDESFSYSHMKDIELSKMKLKRAGLEIKELADSFDNRSAANNTTDK